MSTCSAFRFAALACFNLLTSAPVTAADACAATMVGNVTGVSQTIQPGQPTKTRMAFAVLGGGHAGMTNPLQIAVECTSAMGCYDSW